MFILLTIQVMRKLWGFNMIEFYLNRNVQCDATHKGCKPPYEYSLWLIISGCKTKYFWFGGEWVESEIKDPIRTFALIPIKK